MSLLDIRKKIDEIDSKLVPLIKERMECSLKVAEIKRAENLPVYHPEREREILDRVENEGKEYGGYVRNIYQSIMTTSRALQNNTLFQDGEFAKSIRLIPESAQYQRVICQGADGSFSHAAARKMFGNLEPEFKTSFEDVFKEVGNDENAVGILPVENSTAGSVSLVYDLLLKYNHWIVKATPIDISQNLLSIGKADEIKTVYSHPHAIKQCSEYLKSHGIKAIEFENTALAAKHVSELNDSTIAAIGSLEAAQVYGLSVVEKDIQNQHENITRFIAVSKTPFISPDSKTISLALTMPHEKGSLYSMLGRFAECGLNLTKIESRPTGHKFEYKFYIDFSGSIHDDRTLNLLSALKSELTYFVFLGNYVEN
ncbi:MAG: chorismate mutase [Clostridia bacterium]|nr:chorismate mutase [Clostridia bacterium]